MIRVFPVGGPNPLRRRAGRVPPKGDGTLTGTIRSSRPGNTFVLREELQVSRAQSNPTAQIAACPGIAKAFRTAALLAFLAACGGDPLSPEEAILGTWMLTHAQNEPVSVNYTLIFEQNGVYTFINTIFDGSRITSTGNWRIEQGALFLDALDFGFSIDNDELTLYARDGTVFVYSRQ